MDALDQLRSADAAFVLPKLGGMARPNGVVIVSERYWAFAGTDGTIREGRMPKPPESLNRLPLMRGLVRLFASLSPLFRRTGIARPRQREWMRTGRAGRGQPPRQDFPCLLAWPGGVRDGAWSSSRCSSAP